MDDYRKAFGLRVRELRKEMGFSQERLASVAGLDRSYLGGVERGSRNVSLKNIVEIARALGVPPAELFPAKPVRAPREARAEEDSGPKETDLLFGYGDGVCVPAISWIDENILTPLHKKAVRRSVSS